MKRPTNNIIQAFIDITPYLNDILLEDTAICIQDRETILKYLPGNDIDIGIKDGDTLKKNSVSYEAIQKKARVARTVGREVHGIPYVAVSYPILEDGEAIGSITTITSIDKREKIMDMSETLSTAMEELTASIQSAASASEQLHEQNQQLQAKVTDVEDTIEQIYQVTKMVEDVANKTNILGLNASIEAARAGEYGKGFNVVAAEIRKLALSSGGSVKEINDQLQNINQAIKEFNRLNDALFESSKHLASLTEDLTNGVDSLTNLATELAELSKIES